jgi:hypothetical protein
VQWRRKEESRGRLCLSFRLCEGYWETHQEVYSYSYSPSLSWLWPLILLRTEGRMFVLMSMAWLEGRPYLPSINTGRRDSGWGGPKSIKEAALPMAASEPSLPASLKKKEMREAILAL